MDIERKKSALTHGIANLLAQGNDPVKANKVWKSRALDTLQCKLDALQSAALPHPPKKLSQKNRGSMKMQHDHADNFPIEEPVPAQAQNEVEVVPELEMEHGSLADIFGDSDGTLKKKLPPPPDVFTDEVQRIIDEVSVSKTLPKEMTIGIIFALASACIGRARAVRPRPTWQEHANLFMILIAESGSGKSHAVDYIFKYLNKAEAERKAKFKQECRQYIEDLNAYRKSKDPEKKMPNKPVNIQYILDESTMEGASERMEDNPKGLFWLQDEMSGFFTSLDKYNKSGGDGKRRLLSAFNAQKWSTSRKSKDGITEERYLARGSMGIFGNIQPHLLRSLFTYDDVKQGLPQRFMYIRAVVDKPISMDTPDISPDVDSIIERITKRLLSLEMDLDEGGNWQPKYIALEPNAKKVFDHFFKIVTERTFGTLAYEYAVKMLQISLRLALILHLLEWASKVEDTECPIVISYDTMTSAQTLTIWLLNHTEAARQFFPGSGKTERSTPEMLDVEKKLREIIGKMTDEERSAMRSREEVQALAGTEISKEQIGKVLRKLGISYKQKRIGRQRIGGYYFSDLS